MVEQQSSSIMDEKSSIQSEDKIFNNLNVLDL